MADPKIVNLFGELALEQTMQTINTNVLALITAMSQLQVIVGTLNTKTIKSDTDHISGSVTVVNLNGLTDEELRANPIDVDVQFPADLATDNKLNDVITAIQSKLVQTDSLTKAELRELPLEVKVVETPSAKETTLNDLIALTDSIRDFVSSINSNVKLTDSNDTNVNLSGLKENIALRAISKLPYEQTSGNLRVTNTPSGTQTVSIATTGNGVVAQTYFGVSTTYASSLIPSRLAMNQTLNRFTFSE